MVTNTSEGRGRLVPFRGVVSQFNGKFGLVKLLDISHLRPWEPDEVLVVDNVVVETARHHHAERRFVNAEVEGVAEYVPDKRRLVAIGFDKIIPQKELHDLRRSRPERNGQDGLVGGRAKHSEWTGEITQIDPIVITGRSSDLDSVFERCLESVFIGLDVETKELGRTDISLLKLGTRSEIFLLDFVDGSRNFHDLSALLRTASCVLSDDRILKIAHDVRYKLDMIVERLGIQTANVLDVQELEYNVFSVRRPQSIMQVDYGVLGHTLANAISHFTAFDKRFWCRRPLPPRSVSAAGEDVARLLPLSRRLISYCIAEFPFRSTWSFQGKTLTEWLDHIPNDNRLLVTYRNRDEWHNKLCPSCGIVVEPEDRIAHLDTQNHKVLEAEREILHAVEYYKTANRHIDVNFDYEPSAVADGIHNVTVLIENTVLDVQDTLLAVRQHETKEYFKIRFDRQLPLPPRGSAEVEVELNTKLVKGLARTLLIFDFKSSKVPTIMPLELHIKDNIAEQLEAVEPYRPRRRRQLYEEEEYDNAPLVRAPVDRSNRPTRRYLNVLREYKLPANIKPEEAQQPQLLESYFECTSHIDLAAYRDKFHLLLYLEEKQMTLEMREYDMLNVQVDRDRRGRYKLHVPGLSENRPSVMKNDSVILVSEGDPNRTRYEGRVVDTDGEHVFLQFRESFAVNYIDGLRYRVYFEFDRHALRRAHRAIDLICRSPYRFLFPTAEVPATEFDAGSIDLPQVQLYDEKLNAEQTRAIAWILHGGNENVPYFVFGPPGTGKTSTMVEAITQVYYRQRRTRLLVAAPSNAAADLLLVRLLGNIHPEDIFRLNSRSRNTREVDSIVQPFCFIDKENDTFEVPELPRLLRYRVIVTTTNSAATLYSAGIQEGHFGWFFIDEAGQAHEPDLLCAVAGMIGPSSRVVLSGDPKQLGPLIRAATSYTFGLATSYLERLLQNALYEKLPDGQYDPRFITLLVRNYRSHPAIIEFSSQEFYDGTLIAEANLEKRNSLLDHPILQNKSFPIIFHGIDGYDTREGSSPSWFNAEEVSVVVARIEQLLHGTPAVETSEIGVVTPYRRQVQKLQYVFETRGWDDIKVGSVEEFQGQERCVVIISTVRSSSNRVKSDAHFSLGFLTNPKRFNVSVSRAVALLIVIGNPEMLRRDPLWLRFYRFCQRNGACCGLVLPEEEDDKRFLLRAGDLLASLDEDLQAYSAKGKSDNTNGVAAADSSNGGHGSSLLP